MRRLSNMASVVMLASTITGCGSAGSEVSNVPTPSVPQVVKKQPVAKPAANMAMVTQQPVGKTSPEPGLIQATNPQDRAKQVAKGRLDPFSLLPGQSVAILPNIATTKKIVTPPPILPVRTPPPSQIATGTVNRNIGAGSQYRPGQGSMLPTVAPVLPPAPQPDLARGVAVSGVVQVGNEAQAILKVPNEATSRYVREGQWLSNGQVLVKRIELNHGSDPVVILEQYGIEVNKAVGQGTGNPSKTGRPTDATSGSSSPGSAPSSPE